MRTELAGLANVELADTANAQCMEYIRKLPVPQQKMIFKGSTEMMFYVSGAKCHAEVGFEVN